MSLQGFESGVPNVHFINRKDLHREESLLPPTWPKCWTDPQTLINGTFNTLWGNTFNVEDYYEQTILNDMGCLLLVTYFTPVEEKGYFDAVAAVKLFTSSSKTKNKAFLGISSLAIDKALDEDKEQLRLVTLGIQQALENLRNLILHDVMLYGKTSNWYHPAFLNEETPFLGVCLQLEMPTQEMHYNLFKDNEHGFEDPKQANQEEEAPTCDDNNLCNSETRNIFLVKPVKELGMPKDILSTDPTELQTKNSI